MRWQEWSVMCEEGGVQSGMADLLGSDLEGVQCEL